MIKGIIITINCTIFAIVVGRAASQVQVRATENLLLQMKVETKVAQNEANNVYKGTGNTSADNSTEHHGNLTDYYRNLAEKLRIKCENCSTAEENLLAALYQARQAHSVAESRSVVFSNTRKSHGVTASALAKKILAFAEIQRELDPNSLSHMSADSEFEAYISKVQQLQAVASGARELARQKQENQASMDSAREAYSKAASAALVADGSVDIAMEEKVANCDQLNTQPKASILLTTCGASGPYGPTKCHGSNIENRQYQWDGAMRKSGIQTYTAPEDGYYRITAIGAGGGYSFDNLIPGFGAKITATLHLSEGTSLGVIVGQKGENMNTYDPTRNPPCHKCNGAGGGGGATWVWEATSGDGSEMRPLLVAGGGASTNEGTASSTRIGSQNASLEERDYGLDHSGNVVSFSTLTGVSVGEGGKVGGHCAGGGGGGWLNNGYSRRGGETSQGDVVIAASSYISTGQPGECDGGSGGASPRNGGFGGISRNWASGGFGGGGASGYDGGGAGGGYTGGYGGNYAGGNIGSGGGSFVTTAATQTSKELASEIAHGSVLIESLGAFLTEKLKK